MRPEKQYLIDEVNTHLDKSGYVFLTDFSRLTVAESEALRDQLRTQEAEYHVIKNRIFRVAAEKRGMPGELAEVLQGNTAIIVGGKDAGAIAKMMLKYYKDKEKMEVKGAVIGNSFIPGDKIQEFSEMPSLPELQAKLLGVFRAPAQKTVNLFITVPTQMVTVLHNASTQFLNVLNARKFKMEQEGGA